MFLAMHLVKTVTGEGWERETFPPSLTWETAVYTLSLYLLLENEQKNKMISPTFNSDL